MEMEICAAGRPCRLLPRFFERHHQPHCRRHRHQLLSLFIPFRHSLNRRLCISSSFEEDASQNAAGTRMIKVKFVLRRRCEFGQQFFVIGDNKLLGAWAPEAAIPMQWSEGHVWTLQLDILSGTCLEFKVLLKADGEVIEWQPGPNCKLEVSGSVTFPLVSVPWSDGESFETGTLQTLEMSDAQRTYNLVEVASSAKGPSVEAGNVENMDSFLDVSDKPKTDETSADIKTVISKAKDSVDERQEVGTGLITDGGLEDKASEDFLTLYPIPESWYVKESNDIQPSHNFTDPSHGLLEVNATGRDLTSAPELSVNEEDKAGGKAFLTNELNDLIAKATSSEAVNDHACEKENSEHFLDDDESSPRKVATVLAIKKPEDIQKSSGQKVTTLNGPSETVAKPPKECSADLDVLDNEEVTADEQLRVHKNHMEVSAETGVTGTAANPTESELPGLELSTDAIESIETKPAKEKRRGPKGWSKLWDAIVQGRFA